MHMFERNTLCSGLLGRPASGTQIVATEVLNDWFLRPILGGMLGGDKDTQDQTSRLVNLVCN